MNDKQIPSKRLSNYIEEVENATKRSVVISPYSDAKLNDNIKASLEMSPNISAITIHYRPPLPISHLITEMSVAHELTHALMVYALGYQIPCAPKNVLTTSVQTAAEIVDLVDDVIVDALIHRRGFTIDTPEQIMSFEHNLIVLETAKNSDQIDPYEPDPVRAEIKFVSKYIYAWALPKYVKLQPQAFAIFKRFVRRFPEIMKSEFEKAKVIKKAINANDIFTLEGRTKVVVSAFSLWPVDGRIYLAPISAP